MNNNNVQDAIDVCLNELDDIEKKLENESATSKNVKYFTKYALIMATGTIEYSYKNLIADYYSNKSSVISLYLENTIKESASNPTYTNISTLLKNFDEDKGKDFDKAIPNRDRALKSLSSLNKNRNIIAHGKKNNITITFSDIKQYFSDSLGIITALDDILKS